ncbi:MAG: Malate/lactate dehydrogenase [Mesotoga prima]|uniref:Malate/lactate dehydrogenase n=1 Tax=Mesotoga prima TaxID=1184387 RepID=A0A101HSW2_9BACT|nr:MAG: Malate/lactate dehydrogenase [Mesotoga prima]
MGNIYDDVIWVDFDTLETFMKDVFVGVGVPDEDAGICANVLIASDKRGIDSHGVGRLKPIYVDRIRDGVQNPVTDFEIVRESPTTAVVDGHNGMGHVIAYRSMKLAIEKAKAYGMEIWLKKNSGKLLGWLGYTYSRVSRETKDINNNQSYYPYYDRPHQLQIRLAYHLSPRFNFNAALYYMTGGRTTVPSAFYDYNNLIIPIYNEKNNMRLPDYHRLDIAAEFRLSRQGSRFRQILSLSIYNVYNRNNPFLVSFNKIMDDNGNFVVPANFDQKQTIIPTQLSVAGIIPSINYKFSF